MKPVLLLLASLVLAVLIFLSGVVITANVIAKPEQHRFANMDTPDLWTSQPKPVDPSKQQYQRLPPATPPGSVAADASSKPDAPVTGPVAATQSAAATPNAGAANTEVDNTVTGAVNPAPQASMDARASGIGNPPQPAPAIGPAQAAWCYARYRSYRVEDNSYQPYNGPRRQCRPPPGSDAATEAAVETRQEPERPAESEPVPSEAVGAHEEWCFARYRSYRVEDNSYQPFDGSPRRQCQSPYG